ATSSASGCYSAPRKVEGTVGVADALAPVTYQLAFTFTDERKTMTLNLTGSVSTGTPSVVFPDSMPLVGWAIHQIGPYHEQLSDGMKFDYGARPQTSRAATIGELRKLQQ